MTVWVLTKESRFCDSDDFEVVNVWASQDAAQNEMSLLWRESMVEMGIDEDELDEDSDTYIDENSARVDDGDDVILYYIEEQEVQ